jgi:biotin carboxyl carrier protein
VTLSVEVGGRERFVRVSGRQGNYTVLVDTKEFDVDAARIGERWSLLVGRRSYEVVCRGERSSSMTVLVNGRAVLVGLKAPTAPRNRSRDVSREATGAPASASTVVAPMPGRIVKVLVRAGDVVAARQGLIVIEAMKMENELRAPRSGTVKEVRVAENALVEARAVVVIIE